MLDDSKCKHYKPIDNKTRFSCPNCHRWIGIECADHWAMQSRVITSGKYEEYDRMMRSNRGIYIS